MIQPEKDIIEITLLNTKMRIRTSEDKDHLSAVIRQYKEMLKTVEDKMKISDPLKLALIAGLFVTDELITKTSDLKPQAEWENRLLLQLSDINDRLNQCF